MKPLLKLLLLLFLSINSCKAQVEQPRVIKTTDIDLLNNFVFESLKSKRIIMLGDGIHGHGYFKGIVSGILNSWIDSLEKNPNSQTIPHKLFLFLETDSVKQLLFNEVIDYGNFDNYLTEQIDEVTKFGGWDRFSVDNFEFLFELRDIRKRIDELNKKTNKDICLTIKGVEDPPSFINFSTMYQMGVEKYRKELFLWFAKERDKIISKNIIRNLDNNRDYKAIVFYGSAHLIRKYIDKSHWAFSTIQEPIYEYFLAHYLDEYFGRAQVDVYCTVKVHGEATDIIQKYEKDNDYEDYYVKCNVLPDFPFPLYIISNKKILNSLINLTDKYIEGGKEEDYLLFVNFSRLFFNHVKRSHLYFEDYVKDKIDSLATYPLQFTRNDIKFIYKTTRRISKELVDKFDIVKNIEEMDKWIMMIDKFDDKLRYLEMLKRIIYNLPREIPEETFYSNFDSFYHPDLLSQFEIDQIKNRINELKIYYAISSMWVNTKEENENIIKYLKRATDLNYTTVKEWNNWWKKKYESK